MPTFDLRLKAELVNINAIFLTSHMLWRVKYKCLHCQKVSNHFMDLSSDMKQEAGKGIYNLASQCHFCSKLRTADIVANSERPYYMTDQPNFVTVLKLDCCGMEPVEYAPGDGWVVEGKDYGELFHRVDLSGRQWADYDSKRQRPVRIFKLEYEFVKV